jgi:hypothetical protein
MAKNCSIKTKTLREIIRKEIQHTEKPEIADIVEIIRPYYTWEKSELMERELKNKARYIMNTFRDKKKIRTYFLDNNGVYINVEKSMDLDDLDKVNKQLSKKYNGLNGAIAKVKKRIKSLIKKCLEKSDKA